MSSIKTTSFLSKNLELTGTLRLEGGIRIDGKITGNIESKSTIYVGESADIRGTINTENLVSAGKINGDITAHESIQIKTPGSIEGRITTASMLIDSDVYFDGNCQLTAPKEIKSPEMENRKSPKRAISNRK